MTGDPRRLDERGDVPGDVPPPCGPLQRTVQDRVQLVDARGGGSSGEPLGVEALEVFGTEAHERDTSDVGDGVEADE